MLVTAHRRESFGAPLVEADLADTARLDATLAAGRFDAVLHFAAHIVVPESVADPLKYYANNTRNTLGLLQALTRHGVRRLVFSSTAAVYGTPAQIPVAETAPQAPINPYGSSKLMSEWMIRDVAATGALDHVTLRYFNVAGADPGGRLGQATPAATHLIKVAAELACGKRERIDVFGTDYPTPDGTCVRDYIHIEDLARAHVLALEHLASGGKSLTLNCGYGHGYSVREVLEMRKTLGVAVFSGMLGVTLFGDHLGNRLASMAKSIVLKDVKSQAPDAVCELHIHIHGIVTDPDLLDPCLGDRALHVGCAAEALQCHFNVVEQVLQRVCIKVADQFDEFVSVRKQCRQLFNDHVLKRGG